MKIFFTHTHNFKKHNNRYFTTGGLTDKALNRYSDFCEELLIGARVTDGSIEEVKNLSMITDSKVKFKKINYSLTAINTIKNCIKDSDYVIARLPSFFGIVAVFFAKKYNKKVLVEVVGNAFEALWFHSLKGKFLALPFQVFTKLSVLNADYVTYITKNYLQSIYPTNGIKEDGVSNIVFEDFYFLKDKILKKRISKIENENEIKIGMIANLNVRYKGHKELLMAIVKLKELTDTVFSLELVGGGNNEGLKDLIYENNLETNVKILGTIPNERIFDWLDSIDIYVQPSKTEAHGRSVIEAMSRGCSVVSSNIGGMKETVSNEFRFEINNINDFAKKLGLLINYPEKRKEQAYRNYNLSKEFSKSYIEEKRKLFFNKIFI